MTHESNAPEQTAKIAETYGATATQGQIYCLTGEPGAGKTVFAQGFAKGAGYPNRVTSPTFTIMNEYIGGNLPIYHFDLYRLAHAPEDLEQIGYEEYIYGKGVCLIEWAEKAPQAFPQAIQIAIQNTENENQRLIKIENPSH